MVEEADVTAAPAAGWRIKLGAAIFVVSIAGPLALLPLVTAMELSGGTTATLSGFILAGAEGLGIAAVAVMGKSGYAYIKSRVFGFLKRYGPPREVGRARYTVGLVMFALPILGGWLTPYLGGVLPGYEGNAVALAIAGDAIWLASLFVLGGDFWDKLRALFVHGAKAVFPETLTAAAAASSR